MGRSVNKVTLIGKLGRDPDIRYMPNGNAVANLTIATAESYTDRQTGQKVDQTEWHRVVAYERLAEIIQQYVKKGAQVYVEGRLKTREWEKDGIKRYTTEIVCTELLMLDSRPQPPMQPAQNTAGQGGHYQQPAPTPEPAAHFGGYGQHRR
ncbi:single-stranded DNA-binding protein [Thalassolituus marinus]|uniref:Single-stranded DNA-binding protein n=1 Tax=Thalassolituus marinus TaxID=671053 RepID=A0ABS7ZY88_9GAMM|nr:single-stranded DNA-binding protein [Thalassolituus marinus]MCA6065416.1 single-stranded DNA-binding protein [Thalassolituus marinus]